MNIWPRREALYFFGALLKISRERKRVGRRKKSLMVTASRKLENKALFCLLKKKFNSTMKDRMCKVWMTVFSSAAGIFLSFERLVYFTVSKHIVLNSLLYKTTQFKFA